MYMDRSVMMMWIRFYLQKATDKELEYLMNFIRGYLRIGIVNDKKAATGPETAQVAEK